MSSVIDKLVGEFVCSYDKYAEEAFFTLLDRKQRVFIEEEATEMIVEIYDESGDLDFTGALSEFLYINQFDPELVENLENLQEVQEIEICIDGEYFECILAN